MKPQHCATDYEKRKKRKEREIISDWQTEKVQSIDDATNYTNIDIRKYSQWNTIFFLSRNEIALTRLFKATILPSIDRPLC